MAVSIAFALSGESIDNILNEPEEKNINTEDTVKKFIKAMSGSIEFNGKR